ncbi:hypothetical protein BDW75DRAFT_204963 [Aspergillus navahoensis]
MDEAQPPVRAIISCTFCRQKKLRCDRLRPCGSCVKRGLDCVYLSPSPPRRTAPIRSTRQLNQRVRELEELVNALARAKNVPESDHKSEQTVNGAYDAITSSLGRIQVGETGTSYVSGAHWAALQDSIAEIKESIDSDHSLTQNSSEGPALLLGLCPPGDKEDFLAAVPPKAVADRLVSRFFNSMEPGVLIFHAPTFQKEYDRFWTQPQEVSLTWLSMLYGMMCLAIRLHQRAEGEPVNAIGNPEEACNIYRLYAAHCLIKDRYTTPSKYTIEALLTYAQCEYFRSADAQHENWVLFGIIMRLALRMGLHRDGARYPEISCFEAEMRRRIWAFMIQGDALSSFQSGLPRMMHKGVADTKLPLNLLDEDFDENTTSLPPPRPDTDATPLSYVIAKSTLGEVFALITDHMASTEPKTYQSIIQLDNQLNEAYAAVPAHLKFRSVAQSVVDLPHIIMRRYSLEILYQKSRCILHRQHLCDGRSDPRHVKSRQICIDAAMSLLQHQAALDAHVQPGGVLCDSKWFVSSLASHDFILAAMILCLELHHQSRDNGRPGGKDLHCRDGFLPALHTSCQIWSRYKDSSAEAMQAWRSIKIMLGKLNVTSLDPVTPIANDHDLSSMNDRLPLSTPDQPNWVEPPSTNSVNIVNTMALELGFPGEARMDMYFWDFTNDIDWAEFDAAVQSLDMAGNRAGIY